MLSDEETKEARLIFEGKNDKVKACHFCSGIHGSVAGLRPWDQPCPRIKRIERHANGEVAAVEFWPNGDWEDDVVFPADVYEESAAD